VAGSLGIEKTTGLSDYLLGNADIDDIVYNTDVDRLFILPNFEGIQLSGSLISPKMLALLEHINQLDPNLLIIFDMPPILSSDSVLAFAPQVDTLLLVVSEGHTNRNLLSRAAQMIEEIPSVGTVLNRSTEGSTGVGYY
jgi:Mrp family chromosome partitioning ATPase